MAKADYRAALYMRLSKDDDGAAESASITTQRQMLRSYAAEHGYAVQDEYSDDGYSGVSFDRPEFRRMIADIEAKRVNLVIVKDLSRLGRDYITAGQYTEIYFPSKGVRCIAVNDGYDSEGPYTDIAPFKNVIKNISHSGKVSNDFSLFRRFCCINRCFRCSCGKFAIVHGEQAAIGFRAAAIGEKRDLPETHPVQPRTESIRPCRSTRAKPASKELDRALSV